MVGFMRVNRQRKDGNRFNYGSAKYDRIREFKVTQHSDGNLSIVIDIPGAGSGLDLDTTAFLAEADQTARALADTVSERLREFDIDSRPAVTVGAIPLPDNKSKFKRFERET